MIFLLSGCTKTAITGQKSATPDTIQSIGAPITISGNYLCLPRKGTGAECVLGIESGTDGSDYGLVDQNGLKISAAKYTTGAQASVSGHLVSDQTMEANYKVTGTIQIDQ